MFCVDHTPEWNCIKYKENVMTTKSIKPVTTSFNNTDAVACTMEYAPVC
jgi:hypothetical protein